MIRSTVLPLLFRVTELLACCCCQTMRKENRLRRNLCASCNLRGIHIWPILVPSKVVILPRSSHLCARAGLRQPLHDEAEMLADELACFSSQFFWLLILINEPLKLLVTSLWRHPPLLDSTSSPHTCHDKRKIPELELGSCRYLQRFDSDSKAQPGFDFSVRAGEDFQRFTWF